MPPRGLRSAQERLDQPGELFGLVVVHIVAGVVDMLDLQIGVRPSDGYRFMIITCPVRAYYTDAVKVKVETEYSRAFPGGTGEAKCGGNYAGGLYPAMLGTKQGYHQLVWTDGLSHKYIEESGTMNIFFNIDGTLVTPALDGTILRGITRDSIIRLRAGCRRGP